MDNLNKIVIRANKTDPLVDLDFIRKVKILNHGSFGEVWFLIDEKSSKEYALKVFRENCEPEKIEKEVDFNKKLSTLKNSHDYFVFCYGELIFSDFEGPDLSEDKLGLLFEKADGTLTKYLAKNPILSFDELLNIVKCINDGLLILQQNFQCSHLDIKPSNIVFQKPIEKDDLPKFKLIDYGETLFIKSIGTLAKGITIAGTPHYFSPEINFAYFNGTDTTNAINTYKSDAYSMGLTIIETILKRKIKFPKNQKGEERFDEKIHDPRSVEMGPYDNFIGELIEEIKGQYQGEAGINDFIELIGEMLKYNYNKRPSFVEIELRIRKILEVEKKDLDRKVRLLENMKEGGENVEELKQEVEKLYDEKDGLVKNLDDLKEALSQKEENEQKFKRKYEKIKLENQILLENIKEIKKNDPKEETKEERSF